MQVIGNGKQWNADGNRQPGEDPERAETLRHRRRDQRRQPTDCKDAGAEQPRADLEDHLEVAEVDVRCGFADRVGQRQTMRHPDRGPQSGRGQRRQG
ncbi:MAG: hypothetical protein MUP13_07580, partial [Thermoanaerobaculales bacterium]|nr:hypothetical protein [Thermoanaerobaculales bacterium]